MDALQQILKKVGDVQLSLLRMDHPEGKVTMQARVGAADEKLNCVISGENDCGVSLLSKSVNLIQKDKRDYLYITCKVSEEVTKNTSVVISLDIIKACWFTRETKGSVTWLREKYMYDSMDQIDLAS